MPSTPSSPAGVVVGRDARYEEIGAGLLTGSRAQGSNGDDAMRSQTRSSRTRPLVLVGMLAATPSCQLVSGINNLNVSVDAGAHCNGGSTCTNDASSDALDGGAAAAIDVVQANEISATDAASASLNMAAANPGDTIVVAIVWKSDAGLNAVTDSLGNQYSMVAGASWPPQQVGHQYVAFAQVTNGGQDDTIVVTLNGSGQTDIEVYAVQYSGLATMNAFDVSASSSGVNGNSNIPVAVTSGCAMTTYANELIFGFADTTGAAEAGAGFTLRLNRDNNVIEDMQVTEAGCYAATATVTGYAWTVIMAGFRGR